MADKKGMGAAALFALLNIIYIVLLLNVDVKAVGPADTSVGLSTINMAFSGLIGMNMFWYKFTQLLGVMSFAVCGIFVCIGVVQLVRQKSIKKVDRCLPMLGGLYMMTLALYILFEKVIINYRPVIMEGETAPEASFPSSHTMMACVVFGSAAMVLSQYIKNESRLALLRLICFAAIALMVIGRMLSGVHWLSDIIGGALISAFLLSVFGWLLGTEKAAVD